MKTIKFLDTTLRDGEQSPGCSMHINEKLEIAEALEKMGVDIIEAGFPAVSDGDFTAVERIAETVRSSEVTGLARCRAGDIDALYEALKKAASPRFHLFIATSPLHLEHKYRMTQDEVLHSIGEAVFYARKYLSNIQFSFEDASRTPIDFLIKAAKVAVSAGATTINIPDTVGYATPEEMKHIVKTLLHEVDGLDKLTLSVHCHNDLGLAVANSLAAVEAGATQLECAVNGIGERAGNASLEELIMALKTRGDFYGAGVKADSRTIYRTSTLVASVIGLKIPPNKAVVGTNAFSHEAGIHQHGVMRARETYEIMKPEDIGIPDNKITIGKHSGKHAFEQFLKDMGYDIPPSKLNDLFTSFKELADRKKFVSRRDIEALLPRFTRRNAPHAYALETYEITSYKNSAFSEITLKTEDNIITEKESGDGPVDASFKAINNIIGRDFKLCDFSIHSVTEGKDALGEAIVKLQDKDRTISGRGVSTDVLESAILAYINAANKLLSGEENED